MGRYLQERMGFCQPRLGDEEEEAGACPVLEVVECHLANGEEEILFLQVVVEDTAEEVEEKEDGVGKKKLLNY